MVEYEVRHVIEPSGEHFFLMGGEFDNGLREILWDWLAANIKDHSRISVKTYSYSALVRFKDDRDAMLFKLSW